MAQGTQGGLSAPQSDRNSVLRNGIKVDHARMSDMTERQLITLLAEVDERSDGYFSIKR